MRRPVRLLSGAALAVALLVATGCSDTEPSDVGLALTEEAFLETCAPGRTPIEERVCRCAFERVTASLSSEELERLDRNLRDDPDDIPAEVTRAALDCASDPLTPVTDRPARTTTSTTEREP